MTIVEMSFQDQSSGAKGGQNVGIKTGHCFIQENRQRPKILQSKKQKKPKKQKESALIAKKMHIGCQRRMPKQADNKWIASVKMNDENMEVMEQASKFAGNKKCKGKFFMELKKFKCGD